MAYKDSDQIANDSNYTLGDYSFRIERTSVPGSTNDQLTAICTQGGKNARKSIQIPSAYQYNGYYVEANGTTADVYAVVGVPKGGSGGEVPGDNPFGINSFPFSSGSYYFGWRNGSAKPKEYYYQLHNLPLFASFSNGYQTQVVAASSSPTVDNWEFGISETQGPGRPINQSTQDIRTAFTYNGRTVYYAIVSTHGNTNPDYFTSYNAGAINVDVLSNAGRIAWLMLYDGATEYEEKTMLVGRFAIELEDAGGDGPESDWDDPEDSGDPEYTLYVEVIGALSGRHNDPIEDPSYSYIPADKDTAKDYGCGGDGGHGGGGGAGAATVVVYKFATNQAGNKEITALAKRHGYGSGGGKGGKGGDGCILVYY